MFDELFARFRLAPAAQGLLRRVESGSALTCGGVTGSGHAFLAAWLRREFPQRPVVLVAENLKAQEVLHQDLETWLHVGRESKVEGRRLASNATETDSRPSALDPRLRFFPPWEILPHEDKLPHADVISERLETLVALSGGQSAIGNRESATLTTSITALLQRTFPPALFAQRTRTLRRGERVGPLDLIEWLEDNGYDSEAQVSAKGEIALRGGIVDVFPLTSPWPVRLEFFGDELESLRTFDPVTQVSRDGGELTEIILPPAGELGVLKREVGKGGISHQCSVFSVQSEGSSPITHSPSPIPSHQNHLATLLDYLPDDALILLADPEAIEAHAETYAEQVPDGSPFFASWAELRGELLRRRMTVVALGEDEVINNQCSVFSVQSAGAGDESVEAATPPSPISHSLAPILTSLEAFRPISDRMPEQEIALAQRQAFFHQLASWLRQGFYVQVVCNNDGEAQRFQEVWQETILKGPVEKQTAGGQAARPTLQLGTLARGFLCEVAKFVVVTDAEVFGRYKVQRPRRLKSPHAIAARSAMDIDFSELGEGDYVVHLQHGIGRFKGLKLLPVGGKSELGNRKWEIECLVLEYAPSGTDREPPKLYVPITEAHLVSKYVGAGKVRPPLNQLGGKRWEKTKQQAVRAVRDLASELLAIQAKRAVQPGHAFGPDTPWQREFEGSFLFEETADQLRAIEEAKRDLEIAKPMDRLICGDVGFGKTEVAIRAAFKTVMGGKQVAVLVPTTVLAQQHYNTFRERMADYPVRVELLSRYRTRKEQVKVVAQLAAGAVDIVVGTHRLVQSDVAFKDLGLVVIDEEQRFGVLHKEKFKLMRTHVDVLTLSATPIPRTLYLALTGARDMSTIQTPPQDRLPVETIVEHYDERVIRDAILRELERGGQVFFLHNRVQTIEAMRTRLASLVPQARIVVGHGQMSGDELEDVMTQFVNGEADVLLSTTIIESGLDIPNANTLIIDRADRFGLSQLYQLRGRVGRCKHQAFAYLLLPRHARLLTDVRKRMSAIKQYAQLGSGFKIAMRDLEIRGAGNLLGAQQSGHITAVGFELYCNLLKQSVAAQKGERVKQRTNAALRLDFLKLHAVEEEGGDRRWEIGNGADKQGRGGRKPPSISVPRDSDVWVQDSKADDQPSDIPHSAFRIPHSGAFLPPAYIAEAPHRIDAYRRLAQAETKADVDALARELKDRYGKPPKPVELLLLATELKLLAGERGLDAVETKGDKLMLHRRGDYIQLGGKFPRLTKTEPLALLKEIKKLLLSL
jgi:transcription-repair coupling factor (superfamily II helicase)